MIEEDSESLSDNSKLSMTVTHSVNDNVTRSPHCPHSVSQSVSESLCFWLPSHGHEEFANII